MSIKKTEKKVSITHSSAAQYLTFVAASGSTGQSIEMRYQDENIWLTQKMMAVLYDVTVPAINQHLKRIFDDAELSPGAVIQEYLITAADGKGYRTKHYNLQAIVAVGFKVNNPRRPVSKVDEYKEHDNWSLSARPPRRSAPPLQRRGI